MFNFVIICIKLNIRYSYIRIIILSIHIYLLYSVAKSLESVIVAETFGRTKVYIYLCYLHNILKNKYSYN